MGMPFEDIWARLRHSVQERWGELTDEEINMIDGDKDMLVEKVQQKYGRSREDAEIEVNNWYNKLM